jgi:hypothetical protein
MSGGGKAGAPGVAGAADAAVDLPGASEAEATGGAAGTAADGGFIPASHPTLPQVIDLDRSILRAPKVQPIVYASDTGAADIAAFLQELASTSYWGATTSEYGIGALTVLPTITLVTAAPAKLTDDALRSTLAANISGANPPWGPADASTIYLFAFPPSTIESDGNSACCTDYDGYHDELTSGGITVPYAVSCACPGFDGPNVTDLQERTVDISHELVETATDPFPFTEPGYREEDNADISWTIVTGGEVADMCEFNDDANFVPPGSTYMVQRSWSNAAASLLQNPCVPQPTHQPYFNSFPALDKIAYTPGGPNFTTMGLNIPLGQSKTIDLTLFSTAPTGGPWTVTVYDYDLVVGGAARAYLSLSLDKRSGQNGDTLHLTVTPRMADTQLGGEAFIIISDLGRPGTAGFQSNLNTVLVTN